MSFECIEVKKNGLEWLLQMSRPCRVGSYNVDHTWLLVTHLTYLRPPTYLRTYAHRHTHPSITDFLYLTLNSVCTHAYVYAAHSARQLINGRGILLNVTMVTAVKLLHKRVDCSWGGWNKTGKKRGEEYGNEVQERLKTKVGGFMNEMVERRRGLKGQQRVWRWEKRKCIGENEKQGASRSWKG